MRHGAPLDHLGHLTLMLHFDEVFELSQTLILSEFIVRIAELEVTIGETESGQNLRVHLAVLDGGDAVDLLPGLLFGFALQLRVHFRLKLHLFLCSLNEDLLGLSNRVLHFLDIPIHLCVHFVHLSVLVALLIVLQVVNLGLVELFQIHLGVRARLFGHVCDSVLEVFVLLDVGFDV